MILPPVRNAVNATREVNVWQASLRGAEEDVSESREQGAQAARERAQRRDNYAKSLKSAVRRQDRRLHVVGSEVIKRCVGQTGTTGGTNGEETGIKDQPLDESRKLEKSRTFPCCNLHNKGLLESDSRKTKDYL